MIQKGSYLNVIDNSGVKQIACIHVFGGYRKRYAKSGDLIMASIKSIKYKQNIKLKKGDVVRAVVVKTKVFSFLKKEIKTPIKFFENGAIILSNKNKLIGTRIFGGVNKQFRYTRYCKILSMSSGFIK